MARAALPAALGRLLTRTGETGKDVGPQGCSLRVLQECSLLRALPAQSRGIFLSVPGRGGDARLSVPPFLGWAAKGGTE